MSDSNLTVFENNYLETIKRYRDLVETINEFEDTKKKVLKELKRAMEYYGVRSHEIDSADLQCKMTLVAPTESLTIDTKALRISKPDTYDELIEEFPKHTTRDSYVRVTFR